MRLRLGDLGAPTPDRDSRRRVLAKVIAPAVVAPRSVPLSADVRQAPVWQRAAASAGYGDSLSDAIRTYAKRREDFANYAVISRDETPE